MPPLLGAACSVLPPLLGAASSVLSRLLGPASLVLPRLLVGAALSVLPCLLGAASSSRRCRPLGVASVFRCGLLGVASTPCRSWVFGVVVGFWAGLGWSGPVRAGLGWSGPVPPAGRLASVKRRCPAGRPASAKRRKRRRSPSAGTSSLSPGRPAGFGQNRNEEEEQKVRQHKGVVLGVCSKTCFLTKIDNCNNYIGKSIDTIYTKPRLICQWHLKLFCIRKSFMRDLFVLFNYLFIFARFNFMLKSQ